MVDGSVRLYLIEILHQTTTLLLLLRIWLRCILSKFYIKPQLGRWLPRLIIVVSYRNSTSNHNLVSHMDTKSSLYLIEILHQTTTIAVESESLLRCILSKFYIKPQRLSNKKIFGDGCILSKFYIKPQLRLERELSRCSCILSKFYIKPQHWKSLQLK